MTRWSDTFARLRAEEACGLFPYFTAGFPDKPIGRNLLEAALDAGVDGFEIGVPFSDPLADGATLQRANARALAAGASLDTAFEMARFIRERSPTVPIVLMSYCNPIFRRGERAFAEALAASGADGLIVPDLPLEESETLYATLRDNAMDLVPLLAPTSTPARVVGNARLARAFIYCVSLVGVTGARSDVSSDLGAFLARVRTASAAPLVVGFGISRPEHVRNVAALGADGVIVASALADLVERSADPVADVHAYLREMKAATLPSPVA
ncbi:MAG: tryptophan synthase subunit alpha [Dehalococcoidia bacterium]|nr:tryptophan synthase subunit alpha [Dehalococcoidia bacterium]